MTNQEKTDLKKLKESKTDLQKLKESKTDLQKLKESKSKPTLTTTTNDNIQNITIEKSQLTILESKKGNKYTIISIGEFEIIINSIWIHETKTDKLSVGIKNDIEYPIFKTNEKVKGVDLLKYYFEFKKFEKSNTITK